MANTALTLSTISAIGTPVDYTTVLSTNDTADGKETFDFTPTKPGKKLVIGITNNPAVEAGALAFSVNAGDMWAKKALTGSIAHGKVQILQIDTAKAMKSTGKIEITLTPATGKKLKTGHEAKLFVIECV